MKRKMKSVRTLLRTGSVKGISIFIFLLTYSTFIEAQYFEKITEGALVEIKQRNYSSSWADVNNDGFDDMLILDLNVDLQSMLYMNNGDGTFTANQNSGISEHLGPSIAASWADFNNDGFLDVYICNTANEGDEQSKNMLFKNNGNGSFTRITNGEIVNDIGWSLGASWADYDRDGFVDLYVANFNEINSFYKNNGDETFTKILTGEIVNESAASYGAYWADVNNDGWPDLFVSNAFGTELPPDQNCLFLNNGDGSFTKVVEGHIVNNIGISHGASWGDYDNDGFLDLFVSNHDWSDNKFNFLYKNNGDGSFDLISDINVTTDMNTSYGSAWLDVDNDGYLDLIVANNKSSNRHNFFYINNGDGTFNSIVNDPVYEDVLRSFGMTTSDYNNDGFTDVFVSTYSTNQENGFYKNIGNSNNWLAVSLQGTFSNKAAIGARINIWAGGIMQTREVNSASGQYSSSSFVQNFGTGANTIIDSISVQWPSGIINKLYNTNSNQKINLVEYLPLNNETKILAFSITDQIGETIIDEPQSSITVTMPYGYNITSLSPVIDISDGATIVPASGESVDFSQGAINYTVTAENEIDTQVWLVNVNRLLNNEAKIMAFTIENQVGATIINQQESSITLTMPYGHDLTALSPSIEISAGATIFPASGDSIDFSQGAVSYTVIAENGVDMQVWLVNVLTLPNNEANILSFTIEDQLGESIINNVSHEIAVLMPEGSNLTALIPTIILSDGATINPASGESIDFSQGSVNYTVTAENNSTILVWSVTVTVATSIGEKTVNNEIKISPNPGTGIYFLEINIEETPFELDIIDSSGKLIKPNELSRHNGTNFMVDLTGIPSGMYYLRVITQTKVLISKIIKN